MESYIRFFLDRYVTCSHKVLFSLADKRSSLFGELYLFERKEDDWKLVKGPIPVNFGRAGLAVGIGKHSKNFLEGEEKREGDGKSPLGVFSLIQAFGLKKKEELKPLHFPYEEITEFHEAVDDSHSRYYNRIVDSRNIQDKDWSSSEKMGMEPLYELGIEVGHNYEDPKPERGSAIFIHLRRSKTHPTAGCTALDYSNLEEIIYWLDKESSPVLVQLTKEDLKKIMSL